MKKVRYLISLFFIVLMLAMGINFSSAQKVAYAASQEQIEIQYLASEVLEGQKYQYYDDSEWKDIVMPDGSYPTSAMDMISAFRNCLGSTIAYYGELYPSLAQIRVVKNGSDYLYDFVGWSAINENGVKWLVAQVVEIKQARWLSRLQMPHIPYLLRYPSRATNILQLRNYMNDRCLTIRHLADLYA